jgi:hypothetical protein
VSAVLAAGTGAPPADIPPDELFIRLSSRKRPVELVDFPGESADGQPLGKVAIRVLTQGEMILAKAEATRRARKLIAEKVDGFRGDGDAQVLEDETACQILYQACRRASNPDLPMFPTADKVRQHLTSDEVAVLLNAYAIVQMKLGPLPDAMGKVEYDAWVSRLREGGSELPLALLSLGQLRGLVMHTISLLPSSPADNSSAGSPQEPPTSTP